MTGLYGKYDVRKKSDNTEVTNCFVLRPDRDNAAAYAVLAYAYATNDKRLSKDLRDWVFELQIKSGRKPLVFSNADCLRAMTDEELAGFLTDMAWSAPSDDPAVWLDWLRKPAEGE